MLMLYKEAVVLNGVAQSANLICDLGLVVERSVYGQVSVVLALIEELDGAWVAVVIDVPPASLDSLHTLEDLSMKVNFL